MFTPGQIVAFIIGLCGFILTCLNIIDKLRTLKAAESEPFENLKNRVETLEAETKVIKESLHYGNDKFREQEETNATFKSVMLSFVNFEIAYCLHTDYKYTDELMKAKDELERYLSGKKRHEKT